MQVRSNLADSATLKHDCSDAECLKPITNVLLICAQTRSSKHLPPFPVLHVNAQMLSFLFHINTNVCYFRLRLDRETPQRRMPREKAMLLNFP
jgi:hypothetical protein